MQPKSKFAVNILGITPQSPRPVDHPTVDAPLQHLDAVSRCTECIRYSLLSVEHWMSPEGNIREWLRRNVLLSTFLITPAIFVIPVVGFILWQLTGWLSMLTGTAGTLILILLFVIALRIVTAFLKR